MKKFTTAAALALSLVPAAATAQEAERTAERPNRLLFHGDRQLLGILILSALVAVIVLLTLSGGDDSTPASP